MDIEKRLKQHLADQANALAIESVEPDTMIATVPRSRNAVTGLAALFVVVAAAAGFWIVSSDDKGPITEIAAGQADDVNADGERDEAADPEQVADHARLELVDITSDSSPGHGRIITDNGVYYVLSTAPGRVDLSADYTEEQLMELFRQNSFYIYDPDGGWSVTEVEDRFVSDFAVDDGVLYVVSTGSTAGTTAAFGTSTDRGRSWSWTEIDGLPQINQIRMLRNGVDTVIFASRWGYPDHDEALAAARGAGLAVDSSTLRDFDLDGLSYVEIDPDDRCAAVEARHLPEIQEFSRWLREAPEDQLEGQELEGQELELQAMLGYVKEDITAAGCQWNEDWESAGTAGGFEFPEPVRVTWKELGFAPPETWKTWSTTYLYDGERFTDVGKPFEDTAQIVGQAGTADGRLSVSVWEPSLEVEAEIVWSTADGVNWEQSIRRYDDHEDGAYYDAFYPEPRAGDHTFRMLWDEETSIEYDEAVAVDGQDRGDGATTELVPDEAEFAEPQPLLQRRRGGGPWETVTVADLAPDVDVGHRALQDVRGTSVGLFLVYGEPFGPTGPPDPGLTVVYSNNGSDWDSFELEGNGLDTLGSNNGSEEQMLLFAHNWPYEEGGRSSTQTFLVRAAR